MCSPYPPRSTLNLEHRVSEVQPYGAERHVGHRVFGEVAADALAAEIPGRLGLDREAPPAHDQPSAAARSARWSSPAAGPRSTGRPSSSITGMTSRTDDDVNASSAAAKRASG